MTYAIVSRLESCGGAAGAVISSAIPLPSVPGLCQQRQNFVLNRASHASLAITDIHIRFAPYAESRQINSWLNRITRVRDQVPYVMCFESVHIHSVAVHSLSDAVPGAVEEIFRVTRFFNDAARRFVHLPSLERPARRNVFANQRGRRIARFPHDVKDLRIFLRRSEER